MSADMENAVVAGLLFRVSACVTEGSGLSNTDVFFNKPNLDECGTRR